MKKKIYEFKKTGHDNNTPCKNTYTVVYENKTYYYCKVNGRDELKSFKVEEENELNNNGEFWSTTDFDVSESFQIAKDRKKQDDLRRLNSRIDYVQRELEQLIKKKDSLKN